MGLFQKIKHLLTSVRHTSRDYSLDDIEKYGETLSPNMRALRLSMSIADVLVSMGIGVSDVVSMSLDVTDRYCKRAVQIDISSTLLMFSQDRGNDREPLTMIRTSAPRSTNNMLIQSLQELVRDITNRKLTLEEAETQLDSLLKSPKKYPIWLTTIGSASISAGVGALFDASLVIITTMFLVGAFVAYFVRVLNHKRVPSFFTQIASAVVITLAAAVVSITGKNGSVPLFADVNPTLIVIGGIIMLVAGMTIVGAVQDAIDEFYVTANARLLKVIMMTAGIVAGVLIGLYITTKLGTVIAAQQSSFQIQNAPMQYLGALMISAGYALSMQSRLAGILICGFTGCLAWFVYASSIETGLSVVVASGFAATIVGVFGTMASRVWRIPSTALMTAGIVPLVPGLTLYNGLLEVVESSSRGGSIEQGVLILFNALLIALALASGVSFGNIVTRPVRRTLVRLRNALPHQRLGH